MTEQETQEFATRLARIWNGTTKTRWVRANSGKRWPRQGQVFWHFNAKTQLFHTSTQLPYALFVLVDKFSDDQSLQFRLVWKEDNAHTFYPLIRCELQVGQIYPTDQSEFKQLVDAWMPVFRRNCWLSGCDSEASAHEKAEWMRGFTKEEIESWNLKT